jgi:phage terminase large subunit
MPHPLPVGFSPRSYQLDFLLAMSQGCKRAALVWHRRSGKDKTCLNFTITRMFQRVGSYYYFFPTYTQGNKAIWEAIDKEGMRFLDHFPKALFPSRNETEMSIDAINGSRFQIIGTDNIDRVVGTNPVGCVFSEYSLQNPNAWLLIRPILAENDGWAVFNFTPRGKNWGYELYRMAQANPQWFSSLKTVDDTTRDAEGELGGPVVTPAIIEEERASGMSEEAIQQEYYCSFEGAAEGNYYADLITKARLESRIRGEYFAQAYPVDSGWDIGVDDSTAIVCTQTHGQLPYVIDYHEGKAGGLEVYAKWMQQQPYLWGQHFWPHDAKVTEWGSGKTRIQTAAKLGFTGGGLGPVHVVPKVSLAEGINATRQFLARACYRDHPNVHRFLDLLIAYHREWDPELRVWSAKPIHDYSSHGADALRYRALAWQAQLAGQYPASALTSWSPFADTLPEQADTAFDVFKF